MARIKAAEAAEAKVANGALVVSIPGDAPRVWRAELGGLSSAAFELRDEGARTVLLVRRPGGPEDIFSFPDRAAAVAALQAVTAALFEDGAAALVPAAPAKKKGGVFGRAVKWILILLAAFICFIFAVSSFMPRPAGDVTGAAKGTAVPVPADQVFGK